MMLWEGLEVLEKPMALESGAGAAASSKTHICLTVDLWKEMAFAKFPRLEFTDHLVKTHTGASVQTPQ